MPPAKHEIAAAMFREGGSAEAVMAFLRGRCGTEAALSGAVSRVRSVLMASLEVPPSLGAALEAFRHEPLIHHVAEEETKQLLVCQC